MSELRISLAIQSPSDSNKGSEKKKLNMGDETLAILDAGGIVYSRRSRWDDAKTKIDGRDIGLDLWFKKNAEIGPAIVDGEVGLAVVGRDKLGEAAGLYEPIILSEMGYSGCWLKFGVSESFNYDGLESLIGQRILTAYPRGAERWLQKENIPAAIETNETRNRKDVVLIKPYGGGAETAVRKGFGVGCLEVSETGYSMETNNIRPVQDVLYSEALLVANPLLAEQKGSEKIVWNTLRAIKTGLWKTQYSLLKFNFPEDRSTDIFIEGFPAMDSPTIMPLRGKEGSIETNAGETLVKLNEVQKWRDFLLLRGARSVFTEPVLQLFPDLDNPDIERMMKLIYGRSWQFKEELLAA